MTSRPFHRPMSRATLSRSPASMIIFRNCSAPRLSSAGSRSSAAPMRRSCGAMQPERQRASRLGRVEQALPPVLGSLDLLDEAAVDELLEDPPEALLGDLEDVEQVGDPDARMAVDEVHHPVMRPAEAIGDEHCVGIRDEVAIGKEQELDIGRLRAIALAERLADQPSARPAEGDPRSSSALKFTSAMLTYFWSFVTKMTRSDETIGRAPSFGALPVAGCRQHHIDERCPKQNRPPPAPSRQCRREARPIRR